ncbi:MAG: hypothetical protein P9M08_05095, partial [Candidatus Erginobacter occultus]|nr:hypothetical protein [Candidatus Erginobacter occultus]
MDTIGRACLLIGLWWCLFSSGPALQAADSGITAIWANSGEEKVVRSDLRASSDPVAVLNSFWDGTTVRIEGARNEVVALALHLEASAAGASAVSVAFSRLAGPFGAAIESVPASGEGLFDWRGREIELFFVRYLEIKGLSRLSYESYDERHIPERFRRPWTGQGQGSGTWLDRPDHNAFYPDIAVPLELHPVFAIPAGSTQTIWADIYIPKDVPPGTYSG